MVHANLLKTEMPAITVPRDSTKDAPDSSSMSSNEGISKQHSSFQTIEFAMY